MNDSAYRNGTKVRIHRALAEQVRDHNAEDVAALDAAFFKGTPMTDALNSAVAKAEEVAQSPRIEDHFSAREQYLINIFVDQTVVLFRANPGVLAEQLRADYRGKVVAEADHDGTVTPARRAAGKGGQAGRLANAEAAAAGAGGGKRKAARKAGANAGAKVGGRRAGARRAGAGWANRVKPVTPGEE